MSMHTYLSYTHAVSRSLSQLLPHHTTSLPPILIKPPILLHNLQTIPRHTIHELRSTPPKDIQRGANRQVDFPVAGLADELEVFDCAGAAGVGYGDGAVGGEEADEVEVYAGLEAFVVGGVDEEFGGEGLEGVEGV